MILILGVCWLVGQGTRVQGFALLGPYETWMQPTNGFGLPTAFESLTVPGNVGGPMCISNGYRWNVPVVTYGFDQSFFDFFGTNGVAAVEGAIQTLDDLPPASSIVLTNYSEVTQLVNYEAQAQSLYDLKSVTLSLLLEQLGLAAPAHSVYVLRGWTPLFSTEGSSLNWGDEIIPQFVVLGNYDPDTRIPSQYVNRVLYDGYAWAGFAFNLNLAEVLIGPADLSIPPGTFGAVAENNLELGEFYTGLTVDDVGGLRYLFSTTNANYETLLPGVSGIGTNAHSLVNGALRPGIDKITFLPHQAGANPWDFLPMTNQYTDTYITNGTVMQQQVQRVINQQDFLFCAGDAGKEYPVVLPFARTGTSNWINNAPLNGNSSGAGPGVIQPQVKITFDKLGELLETYGSELQETNYNGSIFWGTYDGSTNPPIVYPLPQSGTDQLTFRLWFPYGPEIPYPAEGIRTCLARGLKFLALANRLVPVRSKHMRRHHFCNTSR